MNNLNTQMGASAIERCCRLAGMIPEKRMVMGDSEIFIADGFCESANVYRWFSRMGVTEDDAKGQFKDGCYATIWWLAKGEDKFFYGRPMFFTKTHNPELPGHEMKKKARVNAAIQDAAGFLKRVKRYKTNG